MHNCKSARRSFVELALNELEQEQAKRLLAELNACAGCRTEYAALTSTLHVSTQALRVSLPSEQFWNGYNSRLQERLLSANGRRNEPVGTRFTPGVWWGGKRDGE